MKFSGITDCNGDPVPYGALVDFTWWAGPGGTVELHCKAKIRNRKSGDVFEFVEDHLGRPCCFTHRLSALNWTPEDLELIKT